MKDELGYQLHAAGRGRKFSESEWRKAIEELLDRFRDFISQDFVRDEDYTVDCKSGSFSRWFWSRPSSSGFLFPIWSAVIGGGCVGNDSFQVSVSLFLFHGSTRERLISSRGGTYLSFSLVEDSSGRSFWKYDGWTTDEWGEWEDLEFTEDDD